MSSKYTNFYSAGELWNRVPDDIYKIISEIEDQFLYTFLDTEEFEIILLQDETDKLISILPI